MPIPPPPPGGPPPPPALSQSSSRPSSLLADRGALLSDICRGTKLKKVTESSDRSAPQLQQSTQAHRRSLTSTAPAPPTPPQAHSPPDSKTPPSEHPYFRLYQYLQQGAPRTSTDKPTGANGSAASSPSGSAPPISSGLFPGGVPKLRTCSDGGRSSSTRPIAPRPPSQRHDDGDGSALSPAPPSQCRRGNAPSPPVNAYNREKPLPPTPPPASKPRPPTSGGNPAPNSLAPPPPPFHRVANGNESGPDLPQRHNSLNKRPAPSPTGHTPTRGPAPPPPSPAHSRATPTSPSPAHQATRPPPPTREPRPSAPPAPAQTPAQPSTVKTSVQTPVQPSTVQSSPRPGCREAPPPPPGRAHGSPALSDPAPSRGKPPPPPRTPAAPPPPPPAAPPHRNGPSSPCIRIDDFESKYSFHPLDDFPPPDEYRHFTKIYPSKANRVAVVRGAPPLPPVAR